MVGPSHYEILGVQPSASHDVIEAVFRVRSKAVHADTSGYDSTEEFQRLFEAYEVLRDPERRRVYDEGSVRAAPRPAPSAAPGIESVHTSPHQPVPLARQFARSTARALASLLLRIVRSSRSVAIGPCGSYRLREAGSGQGDVFDLVSESLHSLPSEIPEVRVTGTPSSTTARLKIQAPPFGFVEASAVLVRNARGTRLKYSVREGRWRIPLWTAIAFGLSFYLASLWATASPTLGPYLDSAEPTALTRWRWPFVATVLALHLYCYLRKRFAIRRAATLHSIGNRLGPLQARIFDILVAHAASLSSVVKQMPRMVTHRGVDDNDIFGTKGAYIQEPAGGVPFALERRHSSVALAALAVARVVWADVPGWTAIGIAGKDLPPDELLLRLAVPLPISGESIVDVHFASRAGQTTATQRSYIAALEPCVVLFAWVRWTRAPLVTVLIWPLLPHWFPNNALQEHLVWGISMSNQTQLLVAIVAVIWTLFDLSNLFAITYYPRVLNSADKARHLATVSHMQMALATAARMAPLPADAPQ